MENMNKSYPRCYGKEGGFGCNASCPLAIDCHRETVSRKRKSKHYDYFKPTTTKELYNMNIEELVHELNVANARVSKITEVLTALIEKGCATKL